MTVTCNPKVAMVSGGGRGIGLEIVRELLSRNWKVSVGMRTPRDLFPEHHENLLVTYFDATVEQSEEDWIAKTAEKFGQIDAIVHNAGVLSDRSVLEASESQFDEIFDINVKSPMRLTQKVWRYLVESEAGKVIIIASLASKRIRAPEATLYSISKFAALGLAHSLRVCGDPVNVRVTAICPGFVATDMASYVPLEKLKKLTQPEDVAKTVSMVLELPSTASIAEIPINWTAESQY